MAITCLGIIPARGGSKGVLRKNIRMVADLPLIAYSINAAASSNTLADFVVSTDDDEIANISNSFGAKILKRPPTLAADNTPMLPVIRHVFSEIKTKSGDDYDIGVILQPTAPMRTAEDIDQAVNILISTGADSVVSVYRVYDHHPARMYKIENDCLVSLEEEPGSRLRQELPPVYHRNGAIYAFRRTMVEQTNSLIGLNTRPYIMPDERSVNIDTEIDLLLADLLLRRKNFG